MNSFSYLLKLLFKNIKISLFFNDILLRFSEIVYLAFEKICSLGTELDSTQS